MVENMRISAILFGAFTLLLYREGSEGNFQADLTLQNVWGRLSLTSQRSMIQCFSTDDAPNKIKFSRRIDTGQGSRLPKFSQQFLQGKPVFARILLMPSDDMLTRFGAYQCKVAKQGETTEVVTLKLPPQSLAELDITLPYQVANIGDDVEFEAVVLKKLELPIRWRRNANTELTSWNDELQVKLSNVQESDSGIYECYYDGRRNESLHAMTRLFVRGCPEGFYGSGCTEECPVCYNGGVCHHKWGVCVCPAGFTGSQCQQACGGNRFGSDCSKLCSPPQNNSNMDDGCAFYTFCKPDPYSCSCAPGFKGAQCMDPCEPGWYGADCRQPCHCAYGVSACHRISGACSGGCAKGWRGNSCEIDDPTATAMMETTTLSYCPVGTYGPNCEKKCHCAGNEPCNIVSGHCPSGCDDGWGGSACNACTGGSFGDNCEFFCHCAGGHINCDKDGYCYTGCEDGWAGFTCQQECMAGRFGQNCASTCHCLLGPNACDRIKGYCDGDCQAGFMGEDCQILCPRNSYGVNCKQNCSCFNDGHCNRIDGTCACEGRWRGKLCNESEPQIVAATDEEVNTGQIVFISCTADAVPEPEMNISCRDFLGIPFNVRSLEKNQYQAVMKVKPQNPGEYDFSCSAKNPHGFDVKIVALTVIDPPKLESSPDAVEITDDSVSLAWNSWQFGVDFGGKDGDHVDYMVVYREAGTAAWIASNVWETEASAAIERLQPYTDYEISVKCRRPDKGGDGEPGPSIVVKTKCAAAPPNAIPQEFLPVVISSESVHLSWKGPSGKSLRCDLTGYSLSYFKEQDSSVVTTLRLNETNDVALKLTSDTSYTFHLFPTTAFGPSKYFAELIIRTTVAVPGPVQDLSYRTEEDTLLVTWKEPAMVYGSIKEYLIRYELTDRGHCGKATDDKDVLGMKSEATHETQIALHDLLPYSTYFVTVIPEGAAGEGEPSSISAMTPEAAPEMGPPNVRVVSVTSHSLHFHWDQIPCEMANGVIVEYEYTLITSELLESEDLPLYGKVKRSADVDLGSVFKKVKGLTALIEGLQPYREYGVAVRGYTKVEAGPFTEFVFAQTEEAVPSAPRQFMIDSVESHCIILSWSRPRPTNGLVAGYRVRFQATKELTTFKDVFNNYTDGSGGPSAERRMFANVTDLEGATNYVFKVQAFTGAGYGDWSEELLGRTSDGVPTMPVNVTITNSEETTLTVSWKPPRVMNGIITGYKITYVPLSTLDLKFDPSSADLKGVSTGGDVTNIVLTNLHDSTQYSVLVRAQTSAGYGDAATAVGWTLVNGNRISASVHTLNFEATNETIPVVFSTEGKASVYKYQVIVEDSLNRDPIDETRLSSYEKAVVEQGLPYYIAAELDPENISDSGQQAFVVGDKKDWGGYRNVHLNPGHKYHVRIRTLVKNNNETKSVLSEPKEQLAVTSLNPVGYRRKYKVLGMELLHFILITIGVLVATCIILFFILLVVCRKKEKQITSAVVFSNRDSGLSESVAWSVMYNAPGSETTREPLVSDGWKYSSTIDKSSLKRSKAYAKNCHGIAVENLANYVHNAKETGSLSEEFKQLVSGQTAHWSIARKSENLKKNRYGNILPYDRTCVKLQPEPNASDSDYINASYVDGYRRQREYIVTQGPLESTIVDFWRMVWQEKSPVIVMLTDLMENGKQKCSKYWPDHSMECKNMQILVIRLEEMNDLIIRTILISKLNETHRVIQYQFTGWPDRTVPLNAYFLLKMVHRVRNDHPVLGGPMVVHCSAGAGRSGTYIALDALIQQATEEKQVDIFRLVNNARLQRINLLQTEEQYLFIHEALLEALAYEETSVPLEQIALHLRELRETSTLDPKSVIRRQFQMLKRSEKKVDVNSCSIAMSKDNIFKNRDPMIVPSDSARIFLFCDSGLEKNIDYINAVPVDGYRKKNGYVVTQMPMLHTVEDFWQMIYQSRSTFILMLNSCDDEGLSNIGVYWPDSGSCSFGNFEVRLVKREDQDDLVIRVMELVKHGESSPESLQLIQMQYNGWTEDEKFLRDPSLMLNLVEAVDSWYRNSEAGPITVHCMDGTSRCGLFCAAAYIYSQVKAERLLEAYEAVISMRTNRPEFISTMEQFAFCFEFANKLSSTLSDSPRASSSTLKRLPYKI